MAPHDEETQLLIDGREEQPSTTPSTGGRRKVFGAIGVAVVVALAVTAFVGSQTKQRNTQASLQQEPVVEHANLDRTESMDELYAKTQNLKVKYSELEDADIDALWKKFIQDHKRLYTSEEEEGRRFKVFRGNLEYIDALNENNPMAVFGITERADWTEEERQITRGLGKNNLDKTIDGMSRYDYVKSLYPDQEAIQVGEQGPDAVAQYVNLKRASSMTGEVGWASESDCAACNMYPDLEKLNWATMPEDFDWRTMGAVSSVKNQKYCGSCWSFSTAGDIEGTHFLQTGELVSLSEQQLVACDVMNDGCDGGYPFAAMQYITRMGGMLHEEVYPYKGICAWGACGGPVAGTPSCDKDLLNDQIQSKNVSSITAFQLVAMGAEYESTMRMALVKNGPISIAFNAAAMDYYVHGIVGCPSSGYCDAGSISHPLTCDPTAIDHAVLIVAYGVENDVPYWVIKNSWGEDWGEEGYYRLIRGVNKCGVANMAVHSVVKPVDA